jgi:hypothetical protein
LEEGKFEDGKFDDELHDGFELIPHPFELLPSRPHPIESLGDWSPPFCAGIAIAEAEATKSAADVNFMMTERLKVFDMKRRL